MQQAGGWSIAGWPRLPRLRPRLTPRRMLALAALALAVLVVGVLGYHAWQTSQYEGLFWQNHTAPNGLQPLYRECMTGVDPTWLLSKDSGRTYQRTTFDVCEPRLAHGTSGAAMIALEPYAYGDAEADLWMFQYSAGATGESGLVLRADPVSGNMVTFGINQPSGTWSLREHARGRWTNLQSPTPSDRIERRANWDNLLSVIMRGDEYALFINYHFVAVYHSGALSQGHVGVFSSDGTVTCGCVDLWVFRNGAG